MRVAITGCGRMGRERARCVRALNATVEFVFDIDAARARELADQCGATVAAGPEEWFEAAVDAVFVCTAPGSRGRIEMACLDHATPFLVEKPIGVSAAPCRELVEGLRQEPVINAVGYMNRYRCSVQRARSILRGVNIIGATAHWICGRYCVPWWQDERFSGGPHNDQATHLFDLNRFLLGEVVQVNGMVESSSRVCCTMRFESGAIGTTLYSCDARAKDVGIRVFAEEGSIALSGWDFRMVENTITGVVPEQPPEDIFLIETKAFLDAVSNGSQGPVQSDIADAFRTQQLMDAVRESAL